MTDATPSEQKAATTSLGDLLGEVTRDLSTLIRQELALARAELKESATVHGGPQPAEADQGGSANCGDHAGDPENIEKK